MTFKVGDKVKCIEKVDVKDSHKFGIIGHVYTVSSEFKNDTPYIILKELDFLLVNSNRFEIINSVPVDDSPITLPELEPIAKPKEVHKCHCEFRELLMFGCRCNGA